MPISAALPADHVPDERGSFASSLGLPPNVIAAMLAFSLLGLLTANPLLTTAALAALPFIVALSWRPGEPPVLTFVLGFHWLQTTAKVFYANALGVRASEVVLFESVSAYANVETATWLSLAGTLAVTLGVFAVLRTLPPPDREAIAERARRFSIPKTFWTYLVVSFALTTLYEGLGYWSAYRSIVLGAVQVKWALYFLLAYLGILRREGYAYVGSAFAIEFISGIGFFSGFKEVIFVTIIAYFAARSKITVGTAARGLVAIVVLMVIGAAWTVVKPTFRSAIGEKGRQGAVVSQEEQITTLVALISELDGAALGAGLEPLVSRISYVDFFGYTLSYVPAVAPHEGGALWGAAVRHILTPRILFPNKPSIVSDSEITNRYTGLGVAGEGQGTSISIGYMAESYVDFGRFWMFLPIFLTGIWRGAMFRFFASSRDMQLLGYAFAAALFTQTYQLEAATGKLLGGVTMRFIVLALLFRFVGPYLMRRLLRSDAHDEAGASAERREPLALPAQQAWS